VAAGAVLVAILAATSGLTGGETLTTWAAIFLVAPVTGEWVRRIHNQADRDRSWGGTAEMPVITRP
jgi:hypothetical protein